MKAERHIGALDSTDCPQNTFKMKKILLAEDDSKLEKLYSRTLESLGYKIISAKNLKNLRKLSKGKYSFVLLNRNFDGAHTDELLKKGELKFKSPVVLISAMMDAEKAAELIEKGLILDFWHKAEGPEGLVLEIKKIEREVKDIRPQLIEFYNGIFNLPHLSRRPVKRKIIAYSPNMVDVLRRAIGFAKSKNLNILIVGEPGTGRSALAEYIVEQTKGNPRIIKIPPGQWGMLSEIEEAKIKVGYGQKSVDSKEIIVIIDGIEEIPREEQVYILGLAKESVARFVSIATMGIFKKLKDGFFSQELYQYISGGLLMIPPLRDRLKEEIALLIEHFLRIEEQERKIKFGMSEEAYRILSTYPWPGNVVELKQKLKSSIATLLPGRNIIQSVNLPQEILQFGKQGNDVIFNKFLQSFITSIDYASLRYDQIENWAFSLKYTLLKLIIKQAKYNMELVKKFLKTDKNIENDDVVKKILAEKMESDDHK